MNAILKNKLKVMALVFSAAWAVTSADAFSQTCGDGTLDAAETCDDGNAAGGDGCDAACSLECGTEGSVNIGLGWVDDDAAGSYSLRNLGSPSAPGFPSTYSFNDLNAAGIVDMTVTESNLPTQIGDFFLSGSSFLGPFAGGRHGQITTEFFETGTTNPIAVSDFTLRITDIDQVNIANPTLLAGNEGIGPIVVTLIDGSTKVYDISLNSTLGSRLLYANNDPANGITNDAIQYDGTLGIGGACDNLTQFVPECLTDIVIPFPVTKVEWRHGPNTGILTPPAAVTTCTIPVCGNNVTEGSEQCDDGADGNGDGCTDTCMTEAGYTCPAAGGNCADIDECATAADNCGANATCTNTPGSFTCACDPGYTGDGITCTLVLVDECALGTDTCDANATCTDATAGFTCACNTGYSGDGFTCNLTAVDECTLGTDNCDVNATCADTADAFTCTCNTGYTGDGVTCADIDECTDGLDDCGANSTCTNTAPGFSCACNDGYALNMAGDCELSEVDECTLGTDNCGENATCTDTVDAFTCACNEGYTGDGITCTDIDECADLTANCDVNATCTNTTPGYDCVCNDGYVGDGFSCALSATDECTLETDNCDENATCTDTAESFSCECNTGYTGDGVTCNLNVTTDEPDVTLQGGGCSSSTGKGGLAFILFAALMFWRRRKNEMGDLI